MRLLLSKKCFGLFSLVLFWAHVVGATQAYDSGLYTNWLKIGGTAAADASAALEINSTTKGFLLPKLTTTQRDAISSPATALGIYNFDTFRENIYDGSNWLEVAYANNVRDGYLQDGDWDSNVNSVNTYDDGTNFVDGTGGSPSSITVGRESASSNVLAGDGSMKIVKAASSCVGEGVSTDSLTVPQFSRQRGELWWSGEYDFTHANYSSADQKLFAYDVTNGAILSVTPISGFIDNTDTKFPKRRGSFMARINIPTTTAKVRLAVHCQTDNASASTWTAYMDKWKLNDQRIIPGAIETPSTSYTPTITGLTNVGVSSARWYRKGHMGYYNVTLSFSGTPAGSSLEISLPSGQVIDTSAQTSGTQFAVNLGGIASNGGSAFQQMFVQYSTTTTVRAVYLSSASTGQITSVAASAPVAWAAGVVMTWTFSAPIVGWADTAAMSAQELNIQTPAPLTVTSGLKTPGSSSIYHALTTNSLTLTTGTWDLTGNCKFDASGGAATYSNTYCLWAGGNGADSASTPTALSAVTGLTVLTTGIEATINATSTANFLTPPTTRVRCTAATCVIFLDTFSIQTTSANARVLVTLNASKVQDFSVYATYPKAPTVSIVTATGTIGNFPAAPSGTYLTPPGTRMLRVRLFGSGGGGSGGGTNPGSGLTGGGGNTTSFGTSLITATGGSAGTIGATNAPNGGAGGSCTINAPAVTLIAPDGADGAGGFNCSLTTCNTVGINSGSGGNSYIGGGGAGVYAGASGKSAKLNSGSGGGGGGVTPTVTVANVSGAGGGAGGYCEAIIYNPGPSYSYVAGAKGGGGSAGSSGTAGGAGGDGAISVEEIY